MEIILKKGLELTLEELEQIKTAILREFKVPFQMADQSPDKLFFLLKQKNEILSMGALWEVKPVIFDGKEFSFFGVLNVVANEKSSYPSGERSIYSYGETLVNTAIIYSYG